MLLDPIGSEGKPNISIDKRDANTADLDTIIGNDTQTVLTSNQAVFKIKVTNTGTEDLTNIKLEDARAVNCRGDVTLPSTKPSTWNNFVVG
jgi:uncharacterized membrane protein